MESPSRSISVGLRRRLREEKCNTKRVRGSNALRNIVARDFGRIGDIDVRIVPDPPPTDWQRVDVAGRRYAMLSTGFQLPEQETLQAATTRKG